MAESVPSLKRLLDYKLLFDCLADEATGKISVPNLSIRWPRDSEVEETKFPSGCITNWKAAADKDGYLDWDAFSSGLITALQKDQAEQKEYLENESSKKMNSSKEHHGESYSLGKSVLINPVKSSEIEEFLSECDGKNLVKTLAQMKKEVYKCQSALQQQQLQKEAESNENGEENLEKPKDRHGDKNISLEKLGSEKTEFKEEDVGNEKEELLKGIEVLRQTQLWFNSRLEQLEIEGSRNKKPSVEELLAIMEGSSVNPAAKTLHHIQKINAHLSSLALHAPMTVSANKPRRSSADMREESRVQRLMSEPGPVLLPNRPRRSHRATVTSPAHSLHPPTTESSARVIGIDPPPTSSMSHLGRDGYGGNVPRRSLSFQEIRASHPSQERLQQTSKRAISSPEKRESDKRSKPRRSHSFNSNSLHSEDIDTARAGTHMEYSSTIPQSQGYPLRVTMSLNQLPNGEVISQGYSSYSSASQRLGRGGLEDSYSGNSIPIRSSSMMTLPSREAQGKEQKKKSSRSLQKKLEKEELRARQVAAHQHVLQTEAYQRPHVQARVTSSRSIV